MVLFVLTCSIFAGPVLTVFTGRGIFTKVARDATTSTSYLWLKCIVDMESGLRNYLHSWL